MWFSDEGKTRPIDIGRKDWEIEREREIREKMVLGKDMELYMTSEGNRIYWRGFGKIQEGGMVEIGFGMKGGARKR